MPTAKKLGRATERPHGNSEPMIRFLTMVKALTSLIVGMSYISGMPFRF